MRAGFDQWAYVLAAYAITIAGTLILAGWSWLSMRRAEALREKVRGKGQD